MAVSRFSPEVLVEIGTNQNQHLAKMEEAKLYFSPQLFVGHINYRVGQTFGQIIVPGRPREHSSPMAIIERSKNIIAGHLDPLLPLPSAYVIDELWRHLNHPNQAQEFISHANLEEITLAHPYPDIETALTRLQFPLEEQFLWNHSFKLRAYQYAQLISSMQRQLLALPF